MDTKGSSKECCDEEFTPLPLFDYPHYKMCVLPSRHKTMNQCRFNVGHHNLFVIKVVLLRQNAITI